MQAERAALATQRAGRGEAGNLRIGYTSTCAFTPVVLDVLRRYQAAHAGVVLGLAEMHTTEQLRAVLDGRIDAAFIRSPLSDPQRQYTVLTLLQEPLVGRLAGIASARRGGGDCVGRLARRAVRPLSARGRHRIVQRHPRRLSGRRFRSEHRAGGTSVHLDHRSGLRRSGTVARPPGSATVAPRCRRLPTSGRHAGGRSDHPGGPPSHAVPGRDRSAAHGSRVRRQVPSMRPPASPDA